MLELKYPEGITAHPKNGAVQYNYTLYILIII